MKTYIYFIGSPFTNPEHRTATVELDLSKEETAMTGCGLAWHDKRDARYPAWRLIWES